MESQTTNGMSVNAVHTDPMHLTGMVIQASVPRALLVDCEPLGRATILVVDRTEINRQLLKGILKAGPYRILEARDSQGAFDILEREVSRPDRCRHDAQRL